MKKLFSFSLGIVLAVALFSFSFGDSILDYLDNVGNDLFGYKPSDKLSVETIENTSITIKSPIVKDDFNDTIQNYVLMYSTKPLSDIIANPSLVSELKEKAFPNMNLTNQSTFTMTLSTADDINPSQIYYLVSFPKDSVGTVGGISNEICFRLSDKKHGEGDSCLTHSAGADMSLASVSHTLNGNLVTLRWISVAGSDFVDIFLWNEDLDRFDKLTTIAMSAETYSFNVNREGSHTVRFVPNNGGKDKHYTFNVLGIATKDETPTQKTPTEVKPVVVGPKENLIMILIGTIVLYMVYKLVRRKA